MRVITLLFFTAQRGVLITKFLKIYPPYPLFYKVEHRNKPSKSKTYEKKVGTPSGTKWEHGGTWLNRVYLVSPKSK